MTSILDKLTAFAKKLLGEDEFDRWMEEVAQKSKELQTPKDDIDSRLAWASHQGQENLLLKVPPKPGCDHGVVFDYQEYQKTPNMSAAEVQTKWPRGWGKCPKGCGFEGIAYASYEHYIAGDW
jgi:hypothetical protein